MVGFTVRNCCCCFSLKVGCYIIGTLQLVAYSLDLKRRVSKHLKEYQEDSFHFNGKTNLSMFFGTIELIELIGSFCLLYGVFSRKTRFITSYLVISTLVTGLLLILTILVIVLPFTQVSWEQFLALVLYNVLLIYRKVVVISYKKEVKEERQNVCLTESNSEEKTKKIPRRESELPLDKYEEGNEDA